LACANGVDAPKLFHTVHGVEMAPSGTSTIGYIKPGDQAKFKLLSAAKNRFAQAARAVSPVEMFYRRVTNNPPQTASARLQLIRSRGYKVR